MIRYPDGQLFLRTLLWKQWLHGSGKSQKVHTWYVECTKNNGPKDTSFDTFYVFTQYQFVVAAEGQQLRIDYAIWISKRV